MSQVLTGRVVTAEFSDGIQRHCANCDGEDCCDCCEEMHQGRAAGAYMTIRLDDPDARIGIGPVTVTYEEATA